MQFAGGGRRPHRVPGEVHRGGQSSSIAVQGARKEPEDPVARALAEHLSSMDVKFYGAQWCPHCKDQKALFGAAAKRLPYVECSPEGLGTPQSQVCMDQNINSYPTWIINGKRYEQIMTMKELADITNFRAPNAPKGN